MKVMKKRLTSKKALYEPTPNYDCHMLRGGTVHADDIGELEAKMLQSQVKFWY